MSRFGSFGGIAWHKSNDGALVPDLSGAFCVVLQRWRRWRRGARLLLPCSSPASASCYTPCFGTAFSLLLGE